MKLANLNSLHVKWFFVSFLALYSVYLVWREHWKSLTILVPLVLVLASWEIAGRWERKQKNRSLARYHSQKVLLWFFFTALLVEIIALLYFQNIDSKISNGAIAFIIGLIYAEREYTRLSRRVKRIKKHLVSI